jgi:hypothetical protein
MIDPYRGDPGKKPKKERPQRHLGDDPENPAKTPERARKKERRINLNSIIHQYWT